MKPTIQDLIEKGKDYRIFFVNGYQEVLKILDFDDEKLLAQDNKGRKKLVFFQAVSTINLD